MLKTIQTERTYAFGLRPCNLHSLQLVDSEPEPEFDKLTLLLQDILAVPVALVSIVQVEKDRQYFKSAQGLPEPWATTRQTPLSHSFCQHVTRCDQLLRVDDARMDPLVRDNLAVRDLGVVAYLGQPIYDANSVAIGALCAIDTKPRAWTDSDVSKIESVAACVSDIIQLRSSMRTVEALHEEQRAFTQALSHDLKAPVNSLTCLLTEVQHAFAENNAPDHQELIELGLQATSRMARQVKGLAEFQRVVASELPSEMVSLNVIVEAALANVRGQMLEANASVCVDELPEVFGTDELLLSLFQNLFDNAIKYRSDQRQLTLRVRCQEKCGFYEIDVIDNGIGIEHSHLHRVFGMFTRLHSQSEIPGTGLGLSICKRIVEIHDGGISIASTPDVGTKFTVRLPGITQ